MSRKMLIFSLLLKSAHGIKINVYNFLLIVYATHGSLISIFELN